MTQSPSRTDWYSMFDWNPLVTSDPTNIISNSSTNMNDTDSPSRPSLLSRAQKKTSLALTPSRSKSQNKSKKSTHDSTLEAREVQVEVFPVADNGLRLLDEPVPVMEEPEALVNIKKTQSHEPSPDSVVWMDRKSISCINTRDHDQLPAHELFPPERIQPTLEELESHHPHVTPTASPLSTPPRHYDNPSPPSSSCSSSSSCESPQQQNHEQKAEEGEEEALHELPFAATDPVGWGLLESQADSAFRSPSAMAARRLGRRRVLPPNSPIRSSIPKRYKGRTHNSAMPRNLQDSLQIETRSNKQPLNKASQSRNSYLPQPKKPTHKILLYKDEIKQKQATRVALWLQPRVRGRPVRRDYLRQVRASRTIQAAFRHFQSVRQEQRRIQSERLKTLAAKASRRAHFRVRDKTLLERKHEATRVICRALYRYHVRQQWQRQVEFEQEKQRAQAVFAAQQQEWAVQVLVRSWRASVVRQMASQERALQRQEQERAGRIILCCFQYYHALCQEERESQARAALVVYRVVSQHYAKRFRLRRIRQGQAARVIQQRGRRFCRALTFQRKVELRRQHEAAFIITTALAAYGQLRHQASRIITRAIAEYTLVRQYSALIITNALSTHCFRRVISKRIQARREQKEQLWVQTQNEAAATIAKALKQHHVQVILNQRIAHRQLLHRSARIISLAMARHCVKAKIEQKIIHRYVQWAAHVVTRSMKRHYFLSVLDQKINDRQKQLLCTQLAPRIIKRALIRNRFLNIMERRINARRAVTARRVCMGLSRQCVLRVLRRRMERMEMVRQTAATRVLQRTLACYMAKRLIERQEEERLYHAAHVIQRMWKCDRFCRALDQHAKEKRREQAKLQGKSRFKAMTRRRTQILLSRRNNRSTNCKS